MFFLLRKTNENKARELMLSGKLIDASYAQTSGIVYKVVPKETIENEVFEFAQKLATETSAEAVALTREMIAEIQSMETSEALLYAASQNATARATNDCKKGIAAFLSKEDIKWS